MPYEDCSSTTILTPNTAKQKISKSFGDVDTTIVIIPNLFVDTSTNCFIKKCYLYASDCTSAYTGRLKIREGNHLYSEALYVDPADL